MFERTRSNIEEDPTYTGPFRYATPHKERIGETPRAASLRELTATTHDQKDERSYSSVRFEEKRKLAEGRSRETNRGIPRFLDPFCEAASGRLTRLSHDGGTIASPSKSPNWI